MNIKLEPQTAIEKDVAKWAKSQVSEGYDGLEAVFADLFYEGCQSGIVSHLVYYTDTIKFYNRHKKEINDLLAETLSNTGLSSPSELFGKKWETENPLGNRNLLAWFAFEESARNLCIRAGIDC